MATAGTLDPVHLDVEDDIIVSILGKGIEVFVNIGYHIIVIALGAWVLSRLLNEC